MKRLLINLALIALIVFVGWRYLAQTILCWQKGGEWSYTTRMCTEDIPTLPSLNELPWDEKPTWADISKLRELIITIPNMEEGMSATLSRTDDALGRFTATFTQVGSPIDGLAEAFSELAVTDEKSGLSTIPFFVNYGGSGSFVYVGLFAHGTSTLMHLDSVLVGDRITIDSVSFEEPGGDRRVVVLFKDRKENEPMAIPPTIPKKLVIPFANGKFGEATLYDRTIDYAMTHKDLLKVETPVPQATVSSPITIRGMARGQWFFEASFPISIVDWDGKIIGEGHAEAQSDWMTSEYVPFIAHITYALSPDTPYRRGAIILKKDNPSGLPENDDALEIPINFK